MRFRPATHSRHSAWSTNQAKIQFPVPNRSLARIASRQKLENNTVPEVAGQGQVRLQCNSVLRTPWKQVTEPGDCRVPAISSHQHSCLEGFSPSRHGPVRSPLARASQRCHRDTFTNSGAKFARTLHRQLIEKAALDRDLRFVAGRQSHRHSSTAKANEFNAIKHTMWQDPNAFRQLEPPQNRPAGRIQAIATNFFAWKKLSLQQERSQTRGRAESSAARSAWATPHDRYIEHDRIICHPRQMQNAFFTAMF